MPKKPKLKLVDAADDAPGSPRQLGVHGRALWRSIQADYAIGDAGGLEYLCLACQALDRAEACRDEIAKTGQTIKLGDTLKDNPLIRHETAARAQVVKCLDKLNLDVAPVKAVGRPPGVYSIKG